MSNDILNRIRGRLIGDAPQPPLFVTDAASIANINALIQHQISCGNAEAVWEINQTAFETAQVDTSYMYFLAPDDWREDYVPARALIAPPIASQQSVTANDILERIRARSGGVVTDVADGICTNHNLTNKILPQLKWLHDTGKRYTMWTNERVWAHKAVVIFENDEDAVLFKMFNE